MTSLPKDRKAVVIYSGGMDSFTILQSVRQIREVYALTFDYGQRHGSKELRCAEQVCQQYNIPHQIIDITSIKQLMQSSSLINSNMDIPDGNYEQGNMKSTVVPNRNMILISMAVSYALSIGAAEVYYGAHSGDHEIYPDCRPVFVEALNKAAALCDWNKVSVVAPYLHRSKAEILQDGLSMQLDYSQTWTCYKGNEKACGKCGACKERLQAFALCGTEDPVKYADQL